MAPAAVALVLVTGFAAGCSASGDDAAPSTTSSAPPATTTPTGSTSAPTTEPTRPDLSPEDLAVAFARDASRGKDLSGYVVDSTVAAEGASLLDFGDPAAAEEWTFTIDETYVDPTSQGGEAGHCQLVGDVTLSCAVMIDRTPTPDTGDATDSLVRVSVTTIDPAASDPSDPRPPVPPYVTAVEVIAG